jgi:hypothetical protein
MQSSFGYADSIYLNPIKQLIAAGLQNIKDGSQLTCDIRDWYYALEEYIEVGKLSYPDGRLVIIENGGEQLHRYNRKLFRPGIVVRDYVEIGGKKIWYVADYAETGNDERAEAAIILESDYAENAMLKFNGCFIRQSAERHSNVAGKIRGYVAYYRIKGVISTVGRDGGEVSENIELYNDGSTIEDIAVSSCKPEVFPETMLNIFDQYTVNKSITAALKPIVLDDLAGLEKVKRTFAEFKQFGEYKQVLSNNLNQADNERDKLLNIYKDKARANIAGRISDESLSLHMAFLGSPGTA